ncbi:RGG repeats nuclear RNA binding protein A-like [Nicotiana tabacum]|uniref:Plasminogen activator inhibitor 1 RNA-binding protein-like n=2 Tax=Nicotiana TaxID=4085 RepID=A0A1S3ZJC9_TOBAC|nr:PREDICTED: plasminogen activator inhibitor 1 RNA-binding protein-like [Nicotiana sylvestris]XP_016464417.1 PREDICTED: plasminogen activator inhibitor 1 RNA-binding protein-like [Nicotiana tabacum]
MADLNPFDLLGDDDNDDPSKLIAIQQQKVDTAKKPSAPAAAAKKQPAKLPTKPPPTAQAVREAKTEVGRGGGRGGGRGYSRGRGGGGFNREASNNENFSRNREFSGGIAAPEDVEGGRPYERRGGYGGPHAFGGGRRGGFSNEEFPEGDRPRRIFERRSGTGRGGEIKREGAGRGNWGTQADEVTQITDEVANEGEKNLNVEKPSADGEAGDDKKENPAAEAEDKEPENKEMTLEEYEKVLEEKRQALQALKTEERKVDIKEFESMQQLSKKSSDDIFIKLGPKDKRRESAEKEEKAKKAVSINEFLKPAEGERYYAPGGRGRGGRGRGSRGYGGGYGGANTTSNVEAPLIEDPGHFPTLGGK